MYNVIYNAQMVNIIIQIIINVHHVIGHVVHVIHLQV